MNRNLLLLSNSTCYGEPYFLWPQEYVKQFFKPEIKSIVFIPYAGVTMSYTAYEQAVQAGFKNTGITVKGIQQFKNAKEAITNAEAIAVGGGNTFRLLEQLYANELIDTIRDKVATGTPYIGWSAGSNVACAQICTTNDMPIVQPPSFNGLGLVPFQINPHFTDKVIPNHGGETRTARLKEYMQLNQDKYAVGLREGSLLKVINQKIELLGVQNMKVFKHGEAIRELSNNDDLSFLLDE